MNKFLNLLFISLFSTTCLAQINMEDSTYSAIGYWDMREQQTYSVTQEKYKIKSGDTTSRELFKYDVDILIRDSTAKTYTIVWKYKNFYTDSDNKMIQKLMSLGNNMDVVIKTDEMGAFQEVVNWKEVRKYMNDALDTLRMEFRDVPNIKEITKQVSEMFTTREAIESGAIEDVLQMYTFNGARYKLNEILTGKQQLANLYGGAPFDADFEIEFTKLDTVNAIAVLRYVHSVDKNQATDQTFEFLKKTARNSGAPEPQRSDIPELSIESRIASSIHGPSGWVIYSINVQEINADNIISVETREIELQ